MLVLDKVLTALRVNAYPARGGMASLPGVRTALVADARAERVALNSKYQQQKGSTEPEFAEKKLHRELARVSLASCLVVVAGDYEPKPSDRLKGQGRVSIADIVASFIAKGDPKLSTKLPEWGTSKALIRRKKIHALFRPAAVFNSVMFNFPVVGIVNDKLRTVRGRLSSGSASSGILHAGVYVSAAITCGRASHLKP
ncbi:uncharacterized protein AMSG_06869 [Thecamonas trahens ATCC 50062]|uniref:Uncharacterized protein n=1 Tax=Thecamonas trahens ATCC 50062 TaxID=461836 RepID=A0A0L0DE05_THETB|nr:hypothetical protein AMSG_06869 [Thecamonas trahens ATCC 50062]KNC50381.1 hypothetical protein AMSG_06869 [Thecamonas trahens ATCC 50062]|eukprot:XP_013756923.1 hypothetical protein AMSG_06869 [Thecamonas trahens ATCC 50062]